MVMIWSLNFYKPFIKTLLLKLILKKQRSSKGVRGHWKFLIIILHLDHDLDMVLELLKTPNTIKVSLGEFNVRVVTKSS